MTVVTAAHPSAAASAEEVAIHAAATQLADMAPELAEAIVEHIRAEIPEFGGLDDALAVAFRSGVEGNLDEIASMLRAGLPAARVTPVGALAYAEAMRRRGVGLVSLARSYHLAVAMFGPVMDEELRRAAPDSDSHAGARLAVDGWMRSYVDRLLGRLADAYEAGEPEHLPSPGDPALTSRASLAAASRFIEQRTATRPSDADARARDRCAREIERFRELVQGAAADPRVSRMLARANTTAVVSLADEAGLAVTLLLDRSPVEVLEGQHDAECELTIASVDLKRLWSDELQLPMAIASGRVGIDGPVRKLVLVWPILHELARRRHEERLSTRPARAGDAEAAEDPGGFTFEQRRLLDEAADHAYRYHEGALEFAQAGPGHFWSIECVDVYKRFGPNQVLNGLTLGIPEGMITVVLGPSGTGKSVLINHLIGLMYPDAGEILVHGRSVARMRRRELLELRRKFGVLFQDGALFGSMPIYDNVAFPLRQHTDLPESEIREIVTARLEDVGLAKAANRMPSELSGGMRKRAGFARALVLEPEIVMFDEPDSGLDPVRTALLCQLIHRMHREHGGTYIVITHDIASMRAIGEYIAVLWKGRIVQSGVREEMLKSNNPFVAQFLAGADVGPLGME